MAQKEPVLLGRVNIGPKIFMAAIPDEDAPKGIRRHPVQPGEKVMVTPQQAAAFAHQLVDPDQVGAEEVARNAEVLALRRQVEAAQRERDDVQTTMEKEIEQLRMANRRLEAERQERELELQGKSAGSEVTDVDGDGANVNKMEGGEPAPAGEGEGTELTEADPAAKKAAPAAPARPQ